jgi:hypothetical protein
MQGLPDRVNTWRDFGGCRTLSGRENADNHAPYVIRRCCRIECRKATARLAGADRMGVGRIGYQNLPFIQKVLRTDLSPEVSFGDFPA